MPDDPASEKEGDEVSDERRALFAADVADVADDVDVLGSNLRKESTKRRPSVPSTPLGPHQFLGFPRLLASLAGVRGGDTIALIAPTGYGKTRLLTAWADATGRHCCVLSLPEEVEAANDLLAFLLGTLNPAAFKLKPRETGAVALDEAELEALADPRALIAVDDLHHATDPTTIKLLVSLINHLPGHRVLALAGRRIPAMRQRNLQNPHRVTQLTFRELGVRRSDLEPLEADGWPAPVLDKVAQLSGGWPAGVRQAIEWFADHGSTGDSRAWCLSEYYQDEVLEGLSPELRDFLREVAVVGSADSGALDWAREADDSADQIRVLRDCALPLVSTDLRSTPWISLHGALATDLASGLSASATKRLGTRAADYFDGTGDFNEAFELLFTFGDKSGAVEFLSRRGPALILRGQGPAVRGWLDRFSPRDLVETPELQLLRAILAALEGEPGTVLMWLEMIANGALQLHSPDEQLAEQYHSLRQAMGIDPPGKALSMALRADDLWAVGVHIIKAYRTAYRGEFGVAEAAFQTLAPFSKPHPLMEIWRAAGLAWVYWETGRRSMGHGLIAETSELWHEFGFTANPTTTQFECMLALYALEAHDQEQAKKHFESSRTKLASLHSALPAERLCATLLLIEVARSIGDELGVEGLHQETEQLLIEAADATHLHTILRRIEASGVDRSSAGSIQLSKAELKILRFLPSHYTVPQIAKSLYLSPATVRTQVQAIYRKLGAHHRAEAVEIARNSGLIN